MFTSNGTALVWRGDGETLLVEAWGENSLRVRSRMMGDVLEQDFALLPAPAARATIDIEGDRAVIRNGKIRAVLTTESTHEGNGYFDVSRCAIEFADESGRVLFKELGPGGSLKLKARRFTPIPGGDFRITASFESDPHEKLYGMGQYQQQLLDLKGSAFELAHRNSQASIPFVVSSAGYGFFWHDPSIGRANFNLNRTEWNAESSKQLDYWVTAGDTPAEIVQAFASVTGKVPMMPEYGLGFWQCRLRYWNQDQLLEVAREYRRRGLPLDVIVCDFFHWPKMGDFRFDEEFFPDPQAMVDELTAMGIELMVSVWPQIALTSENYQEMRDRNLLVKAESGVDVHMRFVEESVFYDVTNPEAQRYVWEKCKQSYHDLGIRAFWLDEAEPEYERYDYANYRYHAGPNVQVGNLYPQLFSKGFYDGMVAAGQTDPVNLVRCAWAGSQRYGALVWSGDIHSTFDDFKNQITAGLQMGLVGIPWWTTDIGGFHGGDGEDPAFRELLVRWFQYGTFCPVMRLHGDRSPQRVVPRKNGSPSCPTGSDNEVWSFGEDVYEVLAHHIRLRETMRPYVRKLMKQAHEDGSPVMRAMFYTFPDDAACWDLNDQYMFGDEILVAPVVELGARERDVYLPAGCSWTNAHDGSVHPGGQTVRAAAPLEVIPLFTRDGSHREIIQVPTRD